MQHISKSFLYTLSNFEAEIKNHPEAIGNKQTKP